MADSCLKYGVKLDPPTFVVFYQKENKTRMKTMPIRKFSVNSPCAFIAKGLKDKHKLGIPQLKIEKMLR